MASAATSSGFLKPDRRRTSCETSASTVTPVRVGSDGWSSITAPALNGTPYLWLQSTARHLMAFSEGQIHDGKGVKFKWRLYRDPFTKSPCCCCYSRHVFPEQPLSLGPMRTTCCIRTYGAASGSTSRTSRGQETEGRCLRHGLEPLRRRVKPVAMYTSRENQVRTPLRPPTHIMLPAVVKLCDFLIRRHGTRIHQVCLRHTQWCRE